MAVKLTIDQRKWLRRIAEAGSWPDRPFLRDAECSVPLMQMGLVEIIDPPQIPGRCKGLPYAIATPAGRQALQEQS